MKQHMRTILEMKSFLLLWLTQSLSSLGSAMTNYALVIWAYQQQGSALHSALLMVCSYAPYVLLSVFAGALSDRWDKRKTMLACDACAAACSLVVLLLLSANMLKLWHLYALNAVNGLMNTVQQPASEVAVTALLPKKHYQRVGGLRYLSNSCNTILTPVIATALMGLFGIRLVILADLSTFLLAFMALLIFIRLPKLGTENKTESFGQSVRKGFGYLKKNRGIFDLILFLAGINLVASMFNAAFAPMMLSRANAGEKALGFMNAFTGVVMLTGSIAASLVKEPKSRVRVIYVSLFLSMSTENFFLAFGKSLPVWCIGAFLGWIAIPLMNANLDAVMRLNIPIDIQGRVFAARNSFQFFTIPLGYFFGGFAVDRIFEPLMRRQSPESLPAILFGFGKGSGAACFFAVLGILGVLICLLFRNDQHIWTLERQDGE